MIGLPVAIVDPGSLAGRDVRAVLRERGFPTSHVHLFHSGAPEGGLLTDDDGEAAFVPALGPAGLSGCSLAFFCGAPGPTGRFLSLREPDGCLAIDLTGQRAGGAFVDAVGGALPKPLPAGDLLLLREPSASVLADAVAALDTLRPVVALTVSVDRPASELGKGALDELFQQAIAIASFQGVPKDHLGAQGAFNLFSPADTDAFDARVAEDVRALLGRDLPVTVLSARAGVFHGTALRLEARFEGEAPAPDAIRDVLLSGGRGFGAPDVDGPAGIVDASGQDETLVLRVSSSGASSRLFLGSDHLRRPGAILAVRVAEAAVGERGLLADA